MHENEISQRIGVVCAFDQKIFQHILLKKWKIPNASDASIASIATTSIKADEPQNDEAFDLEDFVQNFQYLPMDWRAHDTPAEPIGLTQNERQKDSGSKMDKFLANQSSLKSSIFAAFDDEQNVMRIPMLDELAINFYWSQFSQYFNADRKRTWRMLSNALKEYLKLLQTREKLANKCNFQRRRSDELQYFFQNISASHGDDR